MRYTSFDVGCACSLHVRYPELVQHDNGTELEVEDMMLHAIGVKAGSWILSVYRHCMAFDHCVIHNYRCSGTKHQVILCLYTLLSFLKRSELVEVAVEIRRHFSKAHHRVNADRVHHGTGLYLCASIDFQEVGKSPKPAFICDVYV